MLYDFLRYLNKFYYIGICLENDIVIYICACYIKDYIIEQYNR